MGKLRKHGGNVSRLREACWKLESCEAFVPKTEVTLLGCPDGQYMQTFFCQDGWTLEPVDPSVEVANSQCCH